MAIDDLAIFSTKLRKSKNIILGNEDKAGIFRHQDGKFFVELYVKNHSLKRSRIRTSSNKPSIFLTLFRPDLLQHA